MKTLLILIISFSVYSNNLTSLLDKKTQNYKSVIGLYERLINFKRESEFCLFIKDKLSTLEDIYLDDFLLNQELLSDASNDIYVEYALKIKENSRSNLFSFISYLNQCNENKIMPLEKHHLYLKRSIQNQNILLSSHLLFIETIQGLKY